MKRVFLAFAKILIVCSFSLNAGAQQQHALSADYGISFEIESVVLQKPITLFVNLPNRYEETNVSYSILYVLDPEQWFSTAVEASRVLQLNGRIPQTILVGIGGTRTFGDLDDPNVQALILRFISEEAMPYVDQNYRTSSLKSLFAHSATANLAMSILISKPELFSRYVLASPEANQRILSGMQQLLNDGQLRDKTMYLTLTNIDEEGVSRVNGMNALTAMFDAQAPESFSWRFDPIDSLSHFTTPYPTLFEGVAFLHLGYPPTRFADFQRYTEFGGLEEVVSYYNRRADIYDVSALVPESTITGIASMLIQEEQFELANETLKEYQIVYPDSHVILSLISRIHENSGHYADSIAALEMAKVIAENQSLTRTAQQYDDRIESMRKMIR